MNLVDLLAALAAIYLLYRISRRRTYLPLPPGPKGFPIFGNILDIPRTLEWITYHEWSKQLGTNIIHMNMLGQSVIILDTWDAVNELLEKRSAKYSSRPRLPFLNELVAQEFHMLGLLKYGRSWRHQRRLAQSYLSASMPSNFRPQSLRASRHLMARLAGNHKDIKTELRFMAADLIISLLYGLDIRSKEGSRHLQAVQKGAEVIIESVIPGNFLVDLVPIFKYVPEWFPGAGFQTKARAGRKVIADMVTLPFKTAENHMEAGGCPPCFTCQLLQIPPPNEDWMQYRAAVQNVAGSMYVAGADTTVSSLASCILGLLQRPEVLVRAREELDRVIPDGSLPDFDYQPLLPFVTAITKEALRWREVVPLGLPHVIEEEDEYAGYRIPAGSIILPNQWALLHDEEHYPAPFEFRPERFMRDNQFNHDTLDPELVCWGFGRRICPGRFLAFSSIWITLATLIHAFNIEKDIDENGVEITPDPPYSSALVLGPAEFSCQIKPRSEEFKRLVLASIVGTAD